MEKFSDTANRYRNARHKGLAPIAAMAKARDISNHLYTVSMGFPMSEGRGGISRQPQRPDEAWCEDMAGHGLRFVTEGHKLCRGITQGWYTMDDGANDEALVAAVWKLPTRKGREQFIGGYMDPHNDDAAYIDLEIFEDASQAAWRGEHIAQRIASGECDYHRAWQAGARCQTIEDEVKEIRGDTLALLAERRNVALGETPRLCAKLREVARNAMHDIAKLRSERDDLVRDYGTEPGFADA